MNLLCPRCQHSNPAESRACLACGEPFNQPPPLPDTGTRAKEPTGQTLTRMYISLMGVLTIAVIAYRLLGNYKLQQSSALFIGLPALMGVLIALTPKPRTNTGIILRVITLGLLLSGPVLAEGFICIVMSAPIFLGVGLVVGLLTDSAARRKKAKESSDRLRAILPIPLLFLLSLEGTSPQLSFSRLETVSVTRTVFASAAAVEKTLQQKPKFHIPPPGVLGIGFPIPLSGTSSDLRLGSRSEVHFSGGEGRPPGDLALEVTARQAGYVRFTALSDTSHLTHWLQWNGSEVHWKSSGPETTEVTWTIHYERKLDPAWYFGFPERWVVKRCAGYLLTTCATP